MMSASLGVVKPALMRAGLSKSYSARACSFPMSHTGGVKSMWPLRSVVTACPQLWQGDRVSGADLARGTR